MAADGTNLTNLKQRAFRPLAWSPDGERIAFMSDRRDETVEIYVVNADGTDLISLTPHSGHASSPTWSPDGRRIAFGLYGEIYVVDVD